MKKSISKNLILSLFLLFPILILSFFLLTGCGQSAKASEAASSESSETAGESSDTGLFIERIPLEKKSVTEIYDEITQNVALISPMLMSDSFISNYYAINTEKLEEYVFSISEEATSAETIVIMKIYNSTDAESISTALETVIEEKRGEMENYLPEQFALVDKSQVKTDGNYIYLVISEEADSILSIIENHVKSNLATIE